MKEIVLEVSRLVRKVELGRENRAFSRGLDLDVKMSGPAGVEAGHDGSERVVSLGIREQVAAQAETLVVVFALIVGMPQIDESACHRPARARQHATGQLHRPA